MLWIHSIIIPAYALARGFSLSHSLLEGMIVPAAAVLATLTVLPRRARTVAAAAGLLSASAVLVHLSGGLIEMHFHFFVMVAVVALYQDWIPFLAAFAYVLIHHGVMGALDAMSVFNHAAAINHPWKWAAIHALFIAGISGALLVHWRLNETYLAQRKTAEEQAKREASLVSTLNELGREITADLELSHVVQRVTDVATELTSANFGAFFYNVDDPSGDSCLLYTLSGAPKESFLSSPLPRSTPLFQQTFSGQGAVRLDDAREDPRYDQVSSHLGMPQGHVPVRSLLAVPVVWRGNVLGGMLFGHEQTGRFTDEHERLVTGIAAHAAAAIEGAKLLASERRAHARVSVLAEASRVLGKSLELDSILQEFADLVVPNLADTFVADVIGDDGSLRRVALLADRRFVDSAWETQAGPPDPGNTDNPIIRAVATGRSELIEDAAGFPLNAAAADELYQEVLRRIDPATAVVAPLRHRGRVVGVFSIGTVRASGRRLGEQDLHLAEDLARRAAVAVENTSLYAKQRTAAETLQHALLPEELPDLPGLSTAARYVAGGPGVQVGGDWYDAVMLRDGSVALAMGDVVGHGVAAASLMGQLKSALRAYSLDGCEPAAVLQKLNAMLHEFGPGDHMATLVYGRFDPSTGVLRLANAGHPPPLVIAPDGSARFFDETSGIPLGALPRARYTEAVAALEPGSTLVFYTDGLVEDRVTTLEEGMGRLFAAAVAHGDAELGALCDAVLRSVAEEPEGSAGRDDMAILAFRWHSLADAMSLELPARSSVLRPLRATLRRWLRDAGASEEETFEILAAAGEAVTNVIRHSLGRGSGTFDLEASRGDDVCLVIRDRGSNWKDPARERPGGQGLRIMAQFMDAVDIDKGPHGTVVRMRRRLASPAWRID